MRHGDSVTKPDYCYYYYYYYYYVSEEDFEDEKRYQNLPVQELTKEKIDEIYGDLEAKKRRILDNVLNTKPGHLQIGAKRFCDALKCKDRLFILPNECLDIDGKTLCGSHIRRLVMQEVLDPPTPGCIQYKLLEEENKTLRYLLTKQGKALARANGLSRVRKFESLDGTIEYFDYSDDNIIVMTAMIGMRKMRILPIKTKMVTRMTTLMKSKKMKKMNMRMKKPRKMMIMNRMRRNLLPRMLKMDILYICYMLYS